MYFDPSFILPKVIGLLIMAIWIYSSLRDMYLFKYADAVTGEVVDIVDNPDTSSTLNNMASIRFFYKGEKVTIDHYFSGQRNELPKEVKVYISKNNLKRSIVKPTSKVTIFSNLLAPIVFSMLILISFFRIKGC